jgi:hypothetical protein
MAITQEQYYKKADESIDQYNARIASLRAENTPPTTGVPTSGTKEVSPSGTANTILQELSSRLLNQTGITSSDSGAQDIIDESVARIESAEKARKEGLGASLERAKTETAELGEERLTAARELQRGVGPASSFALINKIEEATNKELKDLDMRYQEALASGQMDVANQISNLRLKSIEYKQQAQQQAFQNILSAGSFALSVSQFEAAQEAVKREEQNQIRSLALTYPSAFEGTNVDSLSFEEAYSKARVVASDVEKLSLDYQRAQINSLNNKLTNTPEITASNYDLAKREAVSTFDEIVRSGGKVDADTYLKFRSKVPVSALDNFDNTVGAQFVSTEELRKAGITLEQPKTDIAEENLQSIAEQLVSTMGIDGAKSAIQYGSIVNTYDVTDDKGNVISTKSRIIPLTVADQQSLLNKINNMGGEIQQQEPEEKRSLWNILKNYIEGAEGRIEERRASGEVIPTL